MPYRLLAILTVALLAGCETLHEPLPPTFTGPTARITDTGTPEGGGKARFFVVTEVDGKPIDNALIATRKASSGLGFAMRFRVITRSFPIQPMKLKLVGTHQTAAPIHELASRAAGTFFSVEGVVQFVPKAGAQYIVNGELKKEGSSVWIEDSETHEVVSPVVRSAP